MKKVPPLKLTIRFLILLPYYGIQWFRVLGLRDEERWDKVAEVLTKLHRRVIATNESRHWLGTALLHQHRWQDALNEFERIERPLSDLTEDRGRLLNHALALFQVGRQADAANLLKREIDEAWEGDQLQKAKTLLAQVEQEH